MAFDEIASAIDVLPASLRGPPAGHVSGRDRPGARIDAASVHTTIGQDEWREARIAAGTPPLYADMLLGTFRAARRGDFAVTDPALATLLGRAPRTMHEVLAAAGL